MIDAKVLDDLAKNLTDALPKGLREVQRDVEKNLRAVLSSAFAKMDLVTREEFDVQAAVLARSRAKLEALEKRLAELEAQLLDSTQPVAAKPTQRRGAAKDAEDTPR